MTQTCVQGPGAVHDLEFHLTPGIEPMRADPGQLENAILNLAINARDAMSTGGRLVIETGSDELDSHLSAGRWKVEPGRYVFVSVTDNGEGIPNEFLDRLFEPFFTTKPEGRGTGLGLSMVFGFVKQSGGHVMVNSVPGHGTTVKLYFPAAAATPLHAPARASAEALPSGTETVLVVENDDDILDVACRVLRELGYDVLAARNATEALTIARGRPIDLLFTDVVMPPPMDGFELARALRADRPDLKVLVTSGYAQAAIGPRQREGADYHWLPKPYDRERLARKARAALDP